MWDIFNFFLLTYYLGLLHTIQWVWMGLANDWAFALVLWTVPGYVGLVMFYQSQIYPTWIGPYEWGKWQRDWLLLFPRDGNAKNGIETNLFREDRAIKVCLTKHQFIWLLLSLFLFLRERECEREIWTCCSTYLCIQWYMHVCPLTGSNPQCWSIGQCGNKLSYLVRAKTLIFDF